MADEELNTEVSEEAAPEENEDLRGMLESAFDGEAEGESAEAAPDEAAEGGSPEAAEPAEDGVQEGVQAEEGGSPESTKPPVDWNPELRERWGDLPKEVKAKIADRERQIAMAMQGTAQARQVAQQMGGIAQKYGSVMAAEGVQDPMQMVNNLMQTVTELRMGTPAQKAQKMAQLIQHYGIGVEDLDGALAGVISGDPQQAPAGDPNIENIIEQRLAPVNQMMSQLAQLQQQKQMQTVQGARQEVDEFAKSAEFLNDVKHDVADLIDLATKHGREMSLQEAYDKACSMNPQISKVIQQRAESQQLIGKKNASTSIRPGNLGANPTPNANASIYDSLSAAWDEQIGR